MARKKKTKFLGIRLTEDEINVLEKIRKARGHETISDVVRELIRFVDIYFDERITVERGFKSHILKIAENNFEIFKKYPVADLLKSVPELERAIEFWNYEERDMK